MTSARAQFVGRPKIAASAPDDRDYPYTPPSSGFWFKRGTTLKPYVDRIESQGNDGSCTAHGVTTGCEVVLSRVGAPMQLSRTFNYYLARDYESRLGSEGAVLRDALQAAHHVGLPPESVWPYVPALENTRPGDTVFSLAGQRMLDRYERLNTGPYAGEWQERGLAMKQAIAEGCPVVIAFPIGEQFFDITGPLEYQNIEPMGSTNPFAGNHCVTIVGHMPDIYGPMIFANSWDDWGDNGYGILPMSMTPMVFEAWAIRRFAGYDTSGRTWILNNLDTAIDFVDANVKTLKGCQAVIDACATFNLLRTELEEIMGWGAGSVTMFANSADGATLNWKGFQL